MLAIGLALLSIGLSDPPARTGGYSAEEARARMTVPSGFAVGVFASEPMIRQPVAACFDERGRMWVIEYLQYPTPAGLSPVSVDQYLRTEYDRVPDPPPRGPRGADRIKILEDTDGDGKADKVTTFLEGLNLASGLAVGHGGVYVGQAPYLLFYPDKDKDDRPDGDPEVLLSGFGMQDAHATVNSLAWGPDGWLYGAQGSTVTAKIRGIEFQQGIWRYHPRTRDFELFAEGGGNTWGLDFDLAGNAFGSSNGGFVAFHMVQGGYYWKGFAKHGPLHNPHTFGYFNALEYRGMKPGGHVTPGGIIYKGGAFPDDFRGSFIGGNLLANTVYWYKLDPLGSTFSIRLGGTLLDAHDTWFRPVDLLTGPDGAVYVVDWYDKRASHLDPRDNWDRSNGRIYRIAPKGTQAAKPFDLSQRSSADLIALRNQTNDWYPETSRRILAERRDPTVIEPLERSLDAERDEALALRDLWALNVSGGFGRENAIKLLDHPVPGVRRWTIRLLGDSRMMGEELRARLIDLAGREPDVLVRGQLAASCQRWTPGDALPILDRLMKRDEDAADPDIPMLIWWALERQMRTDVDGVVALLTSVDARRSKLARDVLVERAARALTSRGTDADFRGCARLLDASPEDSDRIVAGMEKGLEGRRLKAVPPALEGPLQRLGARSKPSVASVRLAVRLGSEPALLKARELAADPKGAESDRLQVIEVLGQSGSPGSLSTLLTCFRSEDGPAILGAILNALAGFPEPEVADALLTRYPSLAPTLRDRVRDVLCSRPTWAGKLLGAVGRGQVAAADLRTAQVRQIVQHGDPALTERVERLWGRVPSSNSPEKSRRIAEIRGMLPEGDKGNAARGRVVFRETCMACHRLFGEGELIGPELTGAERGDLDFLLTSLVDPSAVIRKEYNASTVAMADGRVLNGLIVEEGDRTITLLDSQQRKTVLARAEIEAIKPSSTSVMPEGLLDKLGEEQVRDLFRYLQGSGPP